MLIDQLPAYWRPETDQENITWLYFDQPGSNENRLSLAALRELDAILGEIRVEKPKGVVLLSDKPAGFCAGFDLDELADIESDKTALEFYRFGARVTDKLATLTMPTVAVLHGQITMAGLELALACDVRLGLAGRWENTELSYGLLPGFGGLGRIFQRLGVNALGVFLSTKPLDFESLLEIGLLDRLLKADEQIYPIARQSIVRPRKIVQQSNWKRYLTTQWLRYLQAAWWELKIAKRWPELHYPAPHTAIKLWRKTDIAASPYVRGEIRQAAHLLAGETAQNLIHSAIIQRNQKRAVVKSVSKVKPPAHLFVAGASRANLALIPLALNAGMRVTFHDLDARRLQQAKAKISRRLAQNHSRMDERKFVAMGLDFDQDGQAIASADLAVSDPEALQWPVFQREKANRVRVLVSCEMICAITKLKKRARTLAFHEVNLSGKQPLLELAIDWRTSGKTAQLVRRFALNVGALPVSVRYAPGFLVNRVMAAAIDEALILLEGGARENFIDRAARNMGLAVGPIEYARKLDDASLRAILPVPDRANTLSMSRSLLPLRFRKKQSLQAQQEELFERIPLRLYNAAAECIFSRQVKNWRELDAAMLTSGMIADFSGGLLHSIERRGIDTVYGRLVELSETVSGRFKPSKGWSKMVGR